jgi:hypothetical protein
LPSAFYRGARQNIEKFCRVSFTDIHLAYILGYPAPLTWGICAQSLPICCASHRRLRRATSCSSCFEASCLRQCPLSETPDEHFRLLVYFAVLPVYGFHEDRLAPGHGLHRAGSG